MDVSELPGVDNLIVAADNPARDDFRDVSRTMRSSAQLSGALRLGFRRPSTCASLQGFCISARSRPRPAAYPPCLAARRLGLGSGGLMARPRSSAASARGFGYATPSRRVSRRQLSRPPTTTTNAVGQLLAPAALDAALLPEKCFAREFLTCTCRPRFRSIAPGLLPPPPCRHA